uniref:Light organ matrix metalloproteinase 1 n=1 Tax=Euprymna scolopes TaxID=6613 RepID=B7S734_EUPSC|nr:light organ matrix metalloproteinase 1 [Euprymna scolopes]
MLTLFVVLLTWSVVAANPASQYVTPGSAEQEITPSSYELNVDEYLRKYGYMNDVNERSVDYAERRTDAIKLFQEFAGLEVTGEVNEEVRELMLKPRCGMKDIVVGRPENARWNVSEITYSLSTYTKDISESDTRAAIAEALTLWEGPSNLKFKKIDSGTAIMELRFVTGKHKRCPYAMDGSGGVLAHAFFPSKHLAAGDIHFDDDETYKYKNGRGLSLVSIALHESGHSLGLGHDNKKGEIMAGWYSGQTTLGPNDIKRIKALYK